MYLKTVLLPTWLTNQDMSMQTSLVQTGLQRNGILPGNLSGHVMMT